MIEKFIEKFLPQITERVNENAEVGKALIEALAVIDNYATINNVQLSDKQINEMLGVTPEPIIEPILDIPAQIENIVEKKKRGRKPKSASTWTWRFKTEQELIDEYGADWRLRWGNSDRDYLFGEPIIQTDETKEFINIVINQNSAISVNTEQVFELSNPDKNRNYFTFDKDNVTDKPLPEPALSSTATTVKPATWSWRFKTEQEFIDEFGQNFREITKLNKYGQMDYLFGQPIEENNLSIMQIDDIENNGSIYINTSDWKIESPIPINKNSWTIRREYLTEKTFT